MFSILVGHNCICCPFEMLREVALVFKGTFIHGQLTAKQWKILVTPTCSFHLLIQLMIRFAPVEAGGFFAGQFCCGNESRLEVEGTIPSQTFLLLPRKISIVTEKDEFSLGLWAKHQKAFPRDKLHEPLLFTRREGGTYGRHQCTKKSDY